MTDGTLDRDALFVAVVATVDKGPLIQYRDVSGGRMTTVRSEQAVPRPYSLRISRDGNTFVAALNRDGAAWTTVASVDIELPESILAGCAVTSHADTIQVNARLTLLAIRAPRS